MLDINITYTIDIRSQQDLLTKPFSELLLSKSEEMEIHIFHLLKYDPLDLFGRIIDWARRYESTLTLNDSNSLTKLKMLPQYLNK